MSPDARKEPVGESTPSVGRRAFLFGAGARAMDALARAGSRALEAAEALEPDPEKAAKPVTPAPKLPDRPGHDPCLGFPES